MENKKLQAQENFENSILKLKESGYLQKDCSIPLGTNTLKTFASSLPFILAEILLYLFFSQSYSVNLRQWIALLAGLVLSIPVHELLHAFVWIILNKSVKCVTLGFDKKTITPYCACSIAMKKGKYLLGCLAPFLILGVLSGVLAIVFAKLWLLILSVYNIFASSGDIFIAIKAISQKRGSLLLDHYKNAGFIAFYIED